MCVSANQQCPHQFHVKCIFDWLLKSQDCPCCRRDYLSIAPPAGTSLLSDAEAGQPDHTALDDLAYNNGANSFQSGLAPSDILVMAAFSSPV
jgi:hypothetical protein